MYLIYNSRTVFQGEICSNYYFRPLTLKMKSLNLWREKLKDKQNDNANRQEKLVNTEIKTLFLILNYIRIPDLQVWKVAEKLF